MSHGVKISEAGSDIVKGRNTENTTPDHSIETLSYMISGIALPYLRGASVSLQRFNEASQKEKILNLSMIVCMKPHRSWKTLIPLIGI